MVETTNDNSRDNSPSDDSSADKPRKRTRLFGGRKNKAAETEPIVPEPARKPQAEKVQSANVEDAKPQVEKPKDEKPKDEKRKDAKPKEKKAKDAAPEVSPDEAPAKASEPARPTTSLLFQAPDLPTMVPPRANRDSGDSDDEAPTVRRRSRRRSGEENQGGDEGTPPNTVVKVRQPRQHPEPSNEPQKVRGSTRLEAKKQRRRDGRDAGRRRPVITEAEFLARRESVDRVMVVRQKQNRIQIGVLEDEVLVEHYVARKDRKSVV